MSEEQKFVNELYALVEAIDEDERSIEEARTSEHREQEEALSRYKIYWSVMAAFGILFYIGGFSVLMGVSSWRFTVLSYAVTLIGITIIAYSVRVRPTFRLKQKKSGVSARKRRAIKH